MQEPVRRPARGRAPRTAACSHEQEPIFERFYRVGHVDGDFNAFGGTGSFTIDWHTLSGTTASASGSSGLSFTISFSATR